MANHESGRTYSKQRSVLTGESASPRPQSHHNRSASYSGGGVGAANNPVRRSQNYAAKAAAARLAQVMASHSTDNDDDDADDFHQLHTNHSAIPSIVHRDASPKIPRRPLAVAAESRARSPLLGAAYNNYGDLGAVRTATRDKSPLIGGAYNSYGDLGAATSVRTSNNLHPTRSVPTGWHSSNQINGSPRPKPPILPSPSFSNKFSAAQRSISDPTPNIFRDVPHPHGSREEAALQDEIDVLQEENELALSKLRLAEEKLQEREIRNKELEKQIASLGDGVSLEARLLSRKEAFLRQREEALRVEKEQTTDVKDDEIASLRLEAETARDEVLTVTQRSDAAEREVQGLRSITRRMTLTHDEKEEMVLKRCWLARYWGLATKYGILPSVARSKHDHWSCIAPLPLETVISAALANDTKHKKGQSGRDVNDVVGEGNVEGMLAVEKGLRELASLKVEQSVMMSTAQHHHPSSGRSELSPEEMEDIQFKQHWLVFFWRRAKNFKVEADVADDRLAYWTSRCNQSPTSHDVVDVERGLLELHKLGVEEQLWDTTRREVCRAAGNQNLEVDE